MDEQVEHPEIVRHPTRGGFVFGTPVETGNRILRGDLFSSPREGWVALRFENDHKKQPYLMPAGNSVTCVRPPVTRLKKQGAA